MTGKYENSTAVSELNESSSKRVHSGDIAQTTDLEYNSLNLDELRSARYMTEILSHGIRSFATGWLLHDTKMTLWYGDRMGVVLSGSFDIFQEAHYLVLLLAALLSSKVEDLGICPFVKPASNALGQFNGYENLMVEIDNAEADGQVVHDLKFKILQAQPIHADYGLVGQGTTIVPIRAVGHHSPGLGLSRGSLVMKMSWPLKTRLPESHFIQVIRSRLREEKPDMLKHIVDVKYSLRRTMKQVNLPRAFMDLDETSKFEEREFQCLVMPKYERLEAVTSVSEFKKIFVDVVRGALSTNIR